jgi:hypothetical protein
VDRAWLARRGRQWTLTTAAHVVPLTGTAGLLVALDPILAPVAAAALVQAWAIPELYANRGAKVLKPRPVRPSAETSDAEAAAAQRAALGLLGDLVGHDARALHARTGVVLERGRLGVWLVAEAGAVLVRPGGRRADCWCVRVPEPGLPPADRIAHLLLALREDEPGFATVANLAFSGACWRLRRRLPERVRPALDAARALGSRASAPPGV